MRKAVVLLSGGLDSVTTLAIARSQGYACHALTFDYGQRHKSELEAAARAAQQYGAVEHKVVSLDLASIGGSALTDPAIAVPDRPGKGVPVTYVPARNTVFLAIALGWAEVLDAKDIFIGVNAVDYSGYPDCRPEFILKFQELANVATKAGLEGAAFRFHTPLLEKSKAQIIREGIKRGVDYSQTTSCYSADEAGGACGVCDACRLRAAGFKEAGVADPTRYSHSSKA